MEKVIESLQTGTNALLESPTGTGKTISLLCAALSWQEEYASALKVAKALDQLLLKARGTPDQAEVEREVKNELDCRLELIGRLRLPQPSSGIAAFGSAPGRTPAEPAAAAAAAAAAANEGGAEAGFDLKGLGTYAYADEPAIEGGEGALAAGAAAAAESARLSASRRAGPAAHPLIEASRLRHRPPKIIYASRTHSQLSQVIRELKRSAYRPRVTVLASREQLCVDPKVSQLRGATQSYACRNKCRERRCGARNTLEDWVAQKRSVHDLHKAVKGAGDTLRLPQGTNLDGLRLFPGGADAELKALEAAAAAAEAGVGGRRGFGPDGVREGSAVGGGGDAESPAGAQSGAGGGLLDVEELAAMGRSKGVCPYFASRDAVGQLESEIVLVPYNYLVDPEVRRSLSVEWDDAIVIVDEAHNLESVAAEAASFDFGPLDFASAQREVQTYLEGLLAGHGGMAAVETAGEHGAASLSELSGLAQQQGGKVSLDMALKLKDVIRSLEAEVARTVLPPAPSPGKVEPGTAMVALFDEYGINVSTWDQTRALIDGVTEWLMARDSVGGKSRASLAGGGQGGGSGLALDKLKRMIAAALRVSAAPRRDGLEAVDDPGSVARRAATAATAQFFRMVIHRDQRAERRRAESGRAKPDEEPPKVLSYWCFSPGVAFGELKALGVRSVILTSGTLSPMDSYAAELQTPFPVRLENPHVVDASQLLVAVVPKGPTKKALNSSYQNRSKPEYKQELGSAIRNVAKLVPDGLLVFFPSYAVMQDCVTFWKSANGGSAWSSICGLKHTVVEDRNPALLSAQMKEYDEAIKAGKGAAFFAVCRGKVSEGLDFSDAHGRAVIVTGLPFPPKTDAKVVLKQRYLDEALHKTRLARLLPASASSSASSAAMAARAAVASAEGLTGQAWYVQQASRAVNQAIGRVIRHRNDWGAILLFDERFVSAHSQLSAWLRPYARVMDSWGSVTMGLRTFFNGAASKGVAASASSKSKGTAMMQATATAAAAAAAASSSSSSSRLLGGGKGRAATHNVGNDDDDDDDDDEAALERMLPDKYVGAADRLAAAMAGGQATVTAAHAGVAAEARMRQTMPAGPASGAERAGGGGKTTLAHVLAASASSSSASHRSKGVTAGAGFGSALGGATSGGLVPGGGMKMLEQLRRLGEQQETREAADRLHIEQTKQQLRRRLAKASMAARTRDADARLAADEGLQEEEQKDAKTSSSRRAKSLVSAFAGAAMTASGMPEDTDLLADASMLSPASSKPARHLAPVTAPAASSSAENSLREAMQQVLAAAKKVISSGRDGESDPARVASSRTRARIKAIGALVRQWTVRSGAAAGDETAQQEIAADVARRWAEILGVLPAPEEKTGVWSRVQVPMRSRVMALTTLARLQSGSKSTGFKEATKAIVRDLKAKAMQSAKVRAAADGQSVAGQAREVQFDLALAVALGSIPKRPRSPPNTASGAAPAQLGAGAKRHGDKTALG
jgi:regulator of telomere elongation helicase 1